MLNVGCNQVIMVGGRFLSDHTGGRNWQGACESGHAEVIAAARAEGVHLGEEDLEGYMALADTLTQMECRPCETGRTGKAVFRGGSVFWNSFGKGGETRHRCAGQPRIKQENQRDRVCI